MARTINRLSARKVDTIKEPGRHADGGGLYLSISPDGSRRRWVFLFRYRRPGEDGPAKLREKGLGSAATVSLKDARDAAAKVREQLKLGQDPLAPTEVERRIPTFGEMADQVVASLGSGFRNAKHRAQWTSTLTQHAASLRAKEINAVSTDDVVKVLKPIWAKIPETASRVRARIEKVLDAAKASGYRSGENPARWRGHLDNWLPKQQKLSRGHHKALSYDMVPDLVRRLRESGSVSALCLEFTILTAARSGESRSARWAEFDLDNSVWTVPASRMKAGREHRVPLSPRAKAIVWNLAETKVSDFVFPGQEVTRRSARGKGTPPNERGLSDMAMATVLRRMKVDVTVHGFRSSFRDWAAENTNVAREVAEAALAHVLENKVEAAYRRSDLFGKRRELMNLWANHCEPIKPVDGEAEADAGNPGASLEPAPNHE